LRAYAAARIPNYLITHRQDRVCRLCRLRPDAEQYGLPDRVVAFGTSLFLPEPLGFALDTGSFA
jgi:hypothetical protein